MVCYESLVMGHEPNETKLRVWADVQKFFPCLVPYPRFGLTSLLFGHGHGIIA
jgi:hypothetical protein